MLTQSSLTLCDPKDCSPPGSYVHWIFSARALEWGAISSFRGSFQPRDRTCISVSLALQVDSSPLVPPGKPHFTPHVYVSNHNTIHFKYAQLCLKLYFKIIKAYESGKSIGSLPGDPSAVLCVYPMIHLLSLIITQNLYLSGY